MIENKFINKLLDDTSKPAFVNFLIVIWSVIIIYFFLIELDNHNHEILDRAYTESKSSYHKDLTYRLWVNNLGGIYVPDSLITPNPNLAHIYNRDVKTNFGQSLTLVNPAYMTRLVHQLGDEKFGLKTKINSINPINPLNKSDEWESKALNILQKSNEEYFSEVVIDKGKKYFRFIGKFKIDNNCLKCHQVYQNQTGFIPGGISVTKELDELGFVPFMKSHLNFVILTLIVWVIVVIGLIVWSIFYKLRLQEKLKAESSLEESRERYYNLFHNMKEGFAIHEIILDESGKPVDYKFLDLNKAFEKITGLKSEKVMGKTLLEILPNSEFYWIEKYANVAINNVSYTFENYSQELGKYFEVIVYSPKPMQFATIFNDITDRKRQMDELIIKEQAISSSINAIAISDLNGIISYANPSFKKLWDFEDPKDIYGKNVTSFWHHQTNTEMKLNEILEKGSLIDEILAIKSNGDFFEALMTATLVKDNNNINFRIIFSFIDISDKKDNEKKLVQSYKIFETALDMLCTAGYDGYFKTINPSWSNILGWSREELLSKPWIEFVHPEDKNKTNFINTISVGGREILQYENRYICKDGSVRWLSWNSYPSEDEQLVYGAARDITKQRDMEDELYKTQQKFRTIIENAHDGVVLIGIDGKINYASPSAKRMFGYGNDIEVTTINPDENTYPEDLPMVLEALVDVTQNPDKIRIIEYRFKNKNGDYYWIESIFSNQFNVPGVESLVINFRDIHKRKLAEQELSERESLLSTIIQNAPFEIWARDKNGVGILENRLLIEHHGSILGKTPEMSKIDKKTAEIWISNNKRVENGEVINEEVEYTTLVGELTIQNILAPIYLNGKFNGIAGFNIDITERKYNERIQIAQYEIAKYVINSNSLQDLFEKVQAELLKLIDANNLYIALYDETNQTFSSPYNMDVNDDTTTWDADKSLTGLIIENECSIWLKEKEIQELIAKGEIKQIGLQSKAWMGAPIFLNDKISGALVVQSYTDENAYNSKSMEILEIIANQLSTYIEKENIELQLNKNRLHLEAVVKNLPTVLFSIDRNGIFTLSEGKGLHDIGLKAGQVLGLSVYDLYKDHQDILDYVNLALNGKICNGVSIVNEIIFDILYLPMTDSSNNITGMIGVANNITDIYKTREALEISHQTYKGIFDSISELIFVINNDGKIIDINNVVCQYFGLEREELIGKSKEYFGANDLNDYEMIDKYINESFNGNTKRFEFYATQNNGEIKLNEAVSTLGNYFGMDVVILIARDINERKKAEEELIAAKNRAEESDILKSAFLANMSHEIRTPMNAILGFSQLLNENDISKEEKSEYVNIIHRRGHDLLNIINDILDISKIEANQLNIYYNNCDVSTLLNEMFAVYSSFDSNKSNKPVKLILKPILDNIPQISTDEFRLKQVLNNLLGNAFKFTLEGEIEFGCQLKDNMLQFYVKDTGIGIPLDRQKVIFERFRQSNDNHLTREFDGAGLGLAICKGILNLMGGEIWLESKENIGSTFYFSIPYDTIENVEIMSTSDNESEYKWDGKKILIIEDDFVNIKLLELFLKKTKSELIITMNGTQALEKFNTIADIDIILLDIQLPDINGYILAEEILKLKPNAKIISQTANAFSEDRHKAIAAGCVDYISKPINKDELLDMINKYI